MTFNRCYIGSKYPYVSYWANGCIFFSVAVGHEFTQAKGPRVSSSVEVARGSSPVRGSQGFLWM